MQKGVLVTSTSRTGSQKPIDTPGIVMLFLIHKHKGAPGFFVSLFLGTLPFPILMLPIEIGIKHDQQISVTGLTKCPLHVMLALAVIGMLTATSNSII
jgi:hypothetical protein